MLPCKPVSALLLTTLLLACTGQRSNAFESDTTPFDLPSSEGAHAESEPFEPPDAPCGAGYDAKCRGGKACAAGNDCESGTCTQAGVCLYAATCNRDHGGHTCGDGEDCCTSLSVKVGRQTVRLDKFSITAGRMRSFIEATGGNVRAFIEESRPKDWDASWTPFLPTGFEGDYNVYDQLGPAPLYEQVSEASRTFGCYLKNYGARTYWLPDDVNEAYGDIPQVYPQEVLDEKPLNCASAVMMAALCAFDGGRLPTPEELDAAWGPSKFPWGNAPAPFNPEYAPNGSRAYANHGNTYESPPTVGTDLTSHIAPPGRYPKGNGPFGHADLVGNVWNITRATFRHGPYTPDPLHQWLEWSRGGAWEAGQPVPFTNVQLEGEPGFYPRFRAPALRKYWAGGARCAHD